uniref:Uncharacterized protein n=1 Tax=Cucumis melo TaxID=3656 RepID=A0A9I9EGF5_CUCME
MAPPSAVSFLYFLLFFPSSIFSYLTRIPTCDMKMAERRGPLVFDRFQIGWCNNMRKEKERGRSNVKEEIETW